MIFCCTACIIKKNQESFGFKSRENLYPIMELSVNYKTDRKGDIGFVKKSNHHWMSGRRKKHLCSKIERAHTTALISSGYDMAQAGQDDG